MSDQEFESIEEFKEETLNGWLVGCSGLILLLSLIYIGIKFGL